MVEQVFRPALNSTEFHGPLGPEVRSTQTVKPLCPYCLFPDVESDGCCGGDFLSGCWKLMKDDARWARRIFDQVNFPQVESCLFNGGGCLWQRLSHEAGHHVSLSIIRCGHHQPDLWRR